YLSPPHDTSQFHILDVDFSYSHDKARRRTRPVRARSTRTRVPVRYPPAPPGGGRAAMLLKLQRPPKNEIDLPPLDRAMQLAGFAFAQAAVSIAEGVGPLVPLGYVERDAGLRSAERIMMRFTHPSAEDVDLALSVSEGRIALAAKLLEYDTTVLVYDGYVRRS